MEQTRPSFFTLRGLILAAVMLVVYTGLTRYDLNGANPYAASYLSRIEFYSQRIDSLSRVSRWPERMFLRHVANYEIPNWIARNRRPADVILLPPREYAAAYLQADPTWTDPRIFTYMGGFQPIVAWADTTRRADVNAWVTLDPGSIAIVRRGGTMDIDSLMTVYHQSEQQVRP